MGIVIEDDPSAGAQSDPGPSSETTLPVHDHYCPEHGEWSHRAPRDECGAYLMDCPRDDHQKVGEA